jgi:hypothetical protein
MLFLLHKGNHVDLTYRGGQRPIVHLEADLYTVVEWANSVERRWAFSNRNAGTRYARFFDNIDDLAALDWDAISETDWRDPFAKERKQAEFLVEDSFPWELVERIGVIDRQIAERVESVLGAVGHRPKIVVAPEWYY